MSGRSGAASAYSGRSSAYSGRSSVYSGRSSVYSGASTDRDTDRRKGPEEAQGAPGDDEPARKRRLRVSRYRSFMHRYVHHVVGTSYFNNGIMLVILVNMIVMAIQTDKKVAEGNPVAFSAIDIVSLAVYFTEAALKLYVAPRGYWKSGYNVFDFIILVLSIFDLVQLLAPGLLASIGNVKFLRVVRGLRALRALRGISFIEPLQVFMLAIVRTMKSAANLLLLLFLLMYVYAIVAFNFFGETSKAAGLAAWTTLPDCLLTLFDMVTADNWSSFTVPIEQSGDYTIRFLAVAFIAVGHFVFTNLFIGIVVDNLDQAQEEESRRQTERKRRLRAKKLKLIADKQENEVQRLFAIKQETATQRIDDLVQRTVHAMRHDDIVPMTSLACNPVWMQTLAMTLEHHQASMYRNQGLHFEVARTLGEIVMRRLRAARVADGYATRTVAEVVERVKAMAAPSGPRVPPPAPCPPARAPCPSSPSSRTAAAAARAAAPRTAPPVRPRTPGPAPEAEAEAAAVAAAARGAGALDGDGDEGGSTDVEEFDGVRSPREAAVRPVAQRPASRPAAPRSFEGLPGAPTPS
eukprot:tig00001590_g9375.t1